MAVNKPDWTTKTQQDTENEAKGIFNNPILDNESPAIKALYTSIREAIDKTNVHIGYIANEQNKEGITTDQKNAINANTAKTGITNAQRDAIVANTSKTGISTAQKDAIISNTAKVGITNSQAAAIVNNTKKTGITTEQINAITANSAKTGITTSQKNAIIANTAKEGITTTQKKINTKKRKPDNTNTIKSNKNK